MIPGCPIESFCYTRFKRSFRKSSYYRTVLKRLFYRTIRSSINTPKIGMKNELQWRKNDFLSEILIVIIAQQSEIKCHYKCNESMIRIDHHSHQSTKTQFKNQLLITSCLNGLCKRFRLSPGKELLFRKDLLNLECVFFSFIMSGYQNISSGNLNSIVVARYV